MTSFKKVKIKNFKSIKEISFEFDHLNILIGMNGAGKSTILQAMDFLSQLMHGRITEWLDSRDWKAGDLNCKLLKESNIDIEIAVELNNKELVIWSAQFNRTTLRCTTEKITVNGEDAFIIKSRELIIPIFENEKNLEVNSDHSRIRKNEKYATLHEYEGSLLSKLRLNDSHFDFVYKTQLLDFRDFLRNIKSLELLAPHLMRKSGRANEGYHIGIGGEKLSSFLSTLHDEQKSNLIVFLKHFYPNVIDFKIINQRSGWKKLSVIESSSALHIESEARHINDGLLRILAILAQLEVVPSFLMLDEIENGVNQEIIEKLVKVLLSTNTQLLITTHSPLVLNYLPDNIAINAINYVYKSREGDTRYIRFFKIPRINGKLETMGVGDAVLDTNLIELADELNSEG